MLSAKCDQLSEPPLDIVNLKTHKRPLLELIPAGGYGERLRDGDGGEGGKEGSSSEDVEQRPLSRLSLPSFRL